jgi:hypothetical protein
MLATSLFLYALVHCSVDDERLYSGWEDVDGHGIALDPFFKVREHTSAYGGFS